MEWPARSPDLNPIENIWGVMARYVYSGGRQFMSVDDLEDAIYEAWDSIVKTLAVKLRDSMGKRWISVIERRGLKTDY